MLQIVIITCSCCGRKCEVEELEGVLVSICNPGTCPDCQTELTMTDPKQFVRLVKDLFRVPSRKGSRRHHGRHHGMFPLEFLEQNP